VDADLSLRPATAADVAALREVYQRASLSNEGDRPLLALHPELLHWSGDAVRDGRVVVAVGAGAVVGFGTLSLDGATAEVEDLFVDPEWMRRGIGRALIEDLVATARHAGCPFLQVDANAHALAFYTSAGFVAMGEVAVEYGTGTRMRRPT
jgi:GNAT superfamily N-acetyltransferase